MDPILSRQTFTNIFFAYADLQSLPHSFACERCGDSPEIVIADGVSISYAGSPETSLLRPPTRVYEDWPVHREIVSPHPVAFMLLDDHRKAARAAVKALRKGDWDRVAEIVEPLNEPPGDLRSWRFAALSLWVAAPDVYDNNDEIHDSVIRLLGEIATDDNFLQICRPSATAVIKSFFRENFIPVVDAEENEDNDAIAA
jgi:hypothetical protein